MTEHNTCNDAPSGSNEDANKTIGKQPNHMSESKKMDLAVDDGTSIKNSLGGNPGNDSKKSIADSSSLRSIEEENSSEFDTLRDDEVMAMMENGIDKVDKNDNDNFGKAYSGDTAMVESNPDDSMGHHYYSGFNEQDRDNSSVASQAASDNGDFHYNEASFHNNVDGKIRIDGSTRAKQDTAASWLGEANTSASMKTPHASNMTNDKEGVAQERNIGKAGHKKPHDLQDLQEMSDESTQLMNDISSKIDEKLERTRSIAKRLLKEMAIYVQSMEAVASEYQRIHESELRESQRLDAVEPEVNGASDMLLGGGEFLAGTSLGAREQQTRNKPPPIEARRRRSSSPKEERRPVLPRRDCAPTPVINNHCRNKIARDGKENRGSRRRSFG